ncbi:MAG: PD-(D/E)XK nuclease family protein, partial [Chloroflexi bacterium]|nr:PD-(D/E)XK nuclease family protein [Chloroflexota bacterium]
MATTGDGPEEVDDLGLDQKALEALIVDNPDLERLEALLGQFNIFEAIGAVRQEVRHSNFLSFLLNPRETHGLGDEFAKRFLQRVLLTSPQPEMPLRPIDLDLWSLDGLVIQREWENVDILLLDESHKLAAIIENKIDSTERPGQLHRYWNSTSQHYPGWSIVGLYLTPSGDAPECDMYLAVGYSVVCATLENLVGSRAASMGPDVLTMLRHYTQMLRRHIVGESEIDLLCRQIYRKHQRALDIVFERRPDRQSEVRVMVEELIRATPGLVLDRTSKTYIDFGVSAWDVPALLVGKGYTISGRILTFEFANNVDNLKLRLVIGPGP